MSTRAAARPLADKIALVAGATRGAGRGIATMLGAAARPSIAPAAASVEIPQLLADPKQSRRPRSLSNRRAGQASQSGSITRSRMKFALCSSESRAISNG